MQCMKQLVYAINISNTKAVSTAGNISSFNDFSAYYSVHKRRHSVHQLKTRDQQRNCYQNANLQQENSFLREIVQLQKSYYRYNVLAFVARDGLFLKTNKRKEIRTLVLSYHGISPFLNIIIIKSALSLNTKTKHIIKYHNNKLCKRQQTPPYHLAVVHFLAGGPPSGLPLSFPRSLIPMHLSILPNT